MVYYENDDLRKMHFYTHAFYDLTIKYDIEELEELLFMLNEKYNNDVNNKMLYTLKHDFVNQCDVRKCISIIQDFSLDSLFRYDTVVREKFIFNLKKVFDQILDENSYQSN